MPETASATESCRAVVIWIDWYAYHLARFEGLQSAFGDRGEVRGIELVGGVGVHSGLTFREERSAALHVDTLLPQINWADANKLWLSWLLWKRLSALCPEVVLVPGYYTLPAVTAAVWARWHECESVMMTESTVGDQPRSFWKEALKTFVIRMLFTSAVTGGSAHVRYLKQLGFHRKTIVGYYDVVSNDRMRYGVRNIRSTVTGSGHHKLDPYFLYVGRLAPEKNVAGLIRAWFRYREQGGSWQLVIAGDGPRRQELRNLLSGRTFGSDVRFAGHLDSSGLLPYYSFASAFVLPSLSEPWGLVVNEAMAASLPVIVSNRCGCSENLVENGVNGFVFDPDNEEAFIDRLRQMEEMTPNERKRMGESSAQKIRTYSPENFGLSILSIANKKPQNRARSGLSIRERLT